MRALVASFGFSFAFLTYALAPAARAQHSPTVAESSELGAEIRLGDDRTSFAGIYQTPIGARTDVRAGFGIASPDEGDSDVFLTGGIRGLLSRRSSRFPLDIALDGQLDLFLEDDLVVAITTGPSFGGPVGDARALLPYVQPLLVIVTGGDSRGDDDTETDFGIRFGADYALTRTVDLRGDVTIDGDTALRLAIYFQF